MTEEYGRPILQIDGERFYSRVWVIGGDQGDWMGAVYKDPGKYWELTYRFRYYRDEKVWDSEDTKSTYTAYFDPKQYPKKADVLKIVRMMIDEVLVKLGYARSAVHEIVLETNNARTILRAFEREPFMHIKRMTAEEAAKRRG